MASLDSTSPSLGSTVDPTLMAMLGTLRCSLHLVPEPSGHESLSSAIITGFISNYGPDELLRELGGHGVAAVFNGAEPGPTVMVRADLDAVPVEANDSGLPTTEHLCGHDAHSTMVAALAPLLSSARPRRGRVVLMFQPAEETGNGAAAVLADPRFAAIRPDYAIALHNLPGFEVHTVVVREGQIASASVGLECELRGVAAHAAHPEDARSPRAVLARLLGALPQLEGCGEEGRMVTITHVVMGRPGFGVTPGHAKLNATLRAHTSESLTELRHRAETAIREAATEAELDCTFHWLDDYPATRNDPGLVADLKSVCGEQGVPVHVLPRPFPWSDDFGHFAASISSVYFGIGIGLDAVGLHQPGYAFPDEVMSTGIAVLHGLARTLGERDRTG